MTIMKERLGLVSGWMTATSSGCLRPDEEKKVTP